MYSEFALSGVLDAPSIHSCWVASNIEGTPSLGPGQVGGRWTSQPRTAKMDRLVGQGGETFEIGDGCEGIEVSYQAATEIEKSICQAPTGPLCITFAPLSYIVNGLRPLPFDRNRDRHREVSKMSF